MIPHKSSYTVSQDIKIVPKEVLPHFIEQPYIEQLWITVAYNVLMKCLIEDSLDTQLNFGNNFPNTSSDEVKIQKSICLHEHVGYPFLAAIDEFSLYRGTERMHEGIFYTIHLKTTLTDAIKTFVIKGLLQNNMTVDQTKTILFAIVTPEMEWHIGVVTIEKNLTIYKQGYSNDGNIRYSIFNQRKDIIEWLTVQKRSVF